MIADVLIDRPALAERVRDLGARISEDYRDRTPVFVGVLNAAAPFLSDLVRATSVACEIDFVAVTKFDPDRGISIQKDTSIALEGRHVIVVDDTVDTGLTLQYIVRTLQARRPASLAVCALLDRPARRIADIEIAYRGFEIPDVYVVGYGLDYRGRYRELPALYRHGMWP